VNQPHALYRFFAADGSLLYVGITCDVGGRWKQHSKDKPWWTEVVGCTLEHFDDRVSVLAAEQAAIQTERPRYNIVHNRPRLPKPRRRATQRVVWDALQENPRGAVVLAESMPDLCHDYCEKVTSGEYRTVLPFRWEQGLAFYICARGHHWTSWWGHGASGEDWRNAVFLVPYNVTGTADERRALVRCPGCGRRHTHGLDDGWRTSHCGNGARVNYYLTEVEDFAAVLEGRVGRDLLDSWASEHKVLDDLDPYRLYTVLAATLALPRLASAGWLL
jgi:predicted GIY-YIG superfamily endonuclease